MSRIQNWLLDRNSNESVIESEETRSSLLSKPPSYAIVSPASHSGSSRISRQTSTVKRTESRKIVKNHHEDETEV